MYIPIPTNVSELTCEWVSSVLRVDILPQSFQLTTQVDGGGYLSAMGRIQCTTGDGTLLQLIVKMLPNIENSQARELVVGECFDQIEINSYQQLFPQLITIIPELEQYFCPVVYSQIQGECAQNKIPYNSILLLKDLKPCGYHVIPFHEDFGLFGQVEPHSFFCQGLNFLAMFHADSFGLERKLNKHISHIFDWIPRMNSVPKLFSLLPSGFSALYKILDGNSKMISMFKGLEPNALEVLERVLIAGQQCPSVVHGDLWTHNILINTDPSTPIKVIDWQFLAYADPGFDLSVYIVQALNLPYLTKENVLHSMRLYYEGYEDVLQNKLGLKPTRSFPEFETFFRTYGLAYCLFWRILCCPAVVGNQKCYKKVCRIFEIIVEFGVLDFISSEEFLVHGVRMANTI